MEKKKLNKKDFRFRKLENQTLVKAPGKINGIDFNIRFLKNCEVYLCDHIATIYVDDCENCKFYIGPIHQSIFVRDCKNIEVSVAAAQVRISNSSDVVLYSFSQSDPTLENVQNLSVAPYNFGYPGIGEHFKLAGLDVEHDRWNQVADFTKNTDDSNWKVLDPSSWPGIKTKEFESETLPSTLPTLLPKAYGGELDVDIYQKIDRDDNQIGGIQEFAIGTNEEDAFKSIQVNQSEPQKANESNFLGETGLLGANSNQDALSAQLSNTVDLGGLNGGQSQGVDAKNMDAIRLKIQEESNQKMERRQQAIEYLNSFMQNWKTSLQKKNQLAEDLKENNDNIEDSWTFIKENIGEKASDYFGEKDVSVMRNSIIRKSDDKV